MRIDCGLGIAEISNQQSAITIRNRQCTPQSPLRNPQSIRNPQSAIRIDMITPLTPLEFARRTRALYADRDAVVDGALRLTYAQFFDRCDRWSAALQRLGVRAGDRVAYIAPNTHAQLESFYAVPQIGAVLVPINYRLSAEEIAYIIGHSGATVVCAHGDYLDTVDRVRDRLTVVRHFVALDRARENWI